MTVKKIPISTLEMKPDFSNIGSTMQNFNVEKIEKWRKLELLDEEGYPTKQTLKVIREWEIKDFQKDIEKLLSYICKAWHWEDYAGNVRPGIWTFATGGCSANKALLSALSQNKIWSLLNWETIELSGGFLCIATTPEAQYEMRIMEDKIVKWGWKDGKNERNRIKRRR